MPQIPIQNNISLAKVGILYRTTNYKDLLANWNRASRTSNLDSIRKAVRQYGQLSPVIVTTDNDTVDGKHRVIICQDLDIPVLYIKMPYPTDDDVMRVLNIGKEWDWHDYINHNIHLNLDGWQELSDIIELYDSTYSACTHLGLCTPALYNKGVPIEFDASSLNLALSYHKHIMGMQADKFSEVKRTQDSAKALRHLFNAVADSRELTRNLHYPSLFTKMAKYPPNRIPESTMDWRTWMQDAYNQNLNSKRKVFSIAG